MKRNLTATQIFMNAQDLPAEERADYIAQSCAGAAHLEEMLKELVETAGKVDGFMEAPAGRLSDPASNDEEDQAFEAPGTVIGNYKLLQQIGIGGFGVVYMAEQLKPVRRRVAFKIIKLGMDTKEVIARFEAERQALAMMSHPNIAKIFDAGSTDTGRPYFVMELVRGLPITRYCAETNATVRERLKIFLDVCHAVQHAHQKGIIHRDLKPSNVIVAQHEDQPVPRVIDFGVAKAIHTPLTEKTLFTRFEMFVGTPAYMSPEQTQLTDVDIDTRSDIYSLGVLLYELLTGRTPFDSQEMLKSDHDEIKRRIREEEPPKLSKCVSTLREKERTEQALRCRTDPQKLRSALVGDLDWIAMKAMDKNRARRYETANALAADLGRHLGGDPIQARPPSTWYLAGKFAKKYRKGMAFAGSLAVLVLLSMVAVVWQWRAAVANEMVAEFQTKEAQKNHTRAIAYAKEKEIALKQSLVNEGKAWLERSRSYVEKPGSEIYAALMAGSALGFRNYGREHQDADFLSDFPNLIGGETELLNEAEALVQQNAYSARPIWSSPATTHHPDSGNIVEYSPDGKILASGDYGGNIIIWDTASGMKLHTLNHGGEITSLAFSADSQSLASGGRNHQVRIWSKQSQWRSTLLEGHTGFVSDVAFCPDGSLLASCSHDRTIRLWDPHSGAFVRALGDQMTRLSVLEFSPDQKSLAIGNLENDIQIWNFETGELLRVLEGHSNYVLELAYNPDGTSLASVSSDLTLRLWDPTSGVELQAIPQPENVNTGYFRDVDFSPDGRHLASIAGARVHLWETDGLKINPEPRTLGNHQWVAKSTAFSPDGNVLASIGLDRKVHLWNLKADNTHPDSKTRGLGHQLRVSSVAVSPDGRIMASAARGRELKIWDLQTGDQIHSLRTGRHFAETMAISPDGKTLATSHYEPGIVALWDIATGTRLPSLPGFEEGAMTVAFSPDGQFLVGAGTSSEVRIWNLKSKELVGSFRAQADTIGCIAFSPGGNYLATGSYDSSIRIWNFEHVLALDQLSPEEREKAVVGINMMGHTHWVNRIEFSPDGRSLASVSSDKSVRLWDVESYVSKKMRTAVATLTDHNLPVRSLAFRPDGSILATGDKYGTVILWDAETGAVIKTIKCHDQEVEEMAFSPDGKTLITGSRDSTVKMWFLGEDPYVFDQHHGDVASVKLSRDGKTLVSGSKDGTVKILDTQSGILRATLPGHTDRIYSVALSSDGRTVASASNDHTIRLWDLETHHCVRILKGHHRGVLSVAFDPTGRLLASSGKDGRTLLWDMESESSPQVLMGHSGWVYCNAFSLDGKLLITGCQDKSLALWDVTNGEKIATLSGHKDSVRSVAFSPDGKFVVSGSYDKTVKFWDLATIHDPRPPRTLNCDTEVLELAFSIDGKTLATAGVGNVITLWDTESNFSIRTRLSTTGNESDILSLEFARTGNGLFSGDTNNRINFWPTIEGNVVLADYLSNDWFALDGRNVTIPSTSANLFKEQTFGFINVPSHCHLGILQSGMPKKEIDRQLFWLYVRAKNWNSALGQSKLLTDPHSRDGALDALTTWIKRDRQMDALHPGVLAFRSAQLSNSYPQFLAAENGVDPLQEQLNLSDVEPSISIAKNLSGRWRNRYGSHDLLIDHDGDTVNIRDMLTNSSWEGKVEGTRLRIVSLHGSYIAGENWADITDNFTRIRWDDWRDNWRLLRSE